MATTLSTDIMPGNAMDMSWLRESKIKTFYNDVAAKLSKNWNDKSLVTISLIAIVAVSLSFFIIGYGARVLCEIFGLGYPIYITFNILEEGKIADAKPLVMYWSVYGLLQTVQWLPDMTLGYFFWYWILKACFLLWCVGYERKFIGAQYIYTELLMPLYQRNHKNILELEAIWDNIISKVNLGFFSQKAKPNEAKMTSAPILEDFELDHKPRTMATRNLQTLQIADKTRHQL